MALISLEEAKSYLRVDTEDEDAMIAILLSSAGKLCADVARLTDEQWAGRRSTTITLTPPLLLSGKPCGWRSFMRSAICSSIGRKRIITV